MPQLEYYYFESCPFCQMVQDTIDKHNIKVDYNDILKNEEHLKKLIQDTGKRTVPCLYINGKPMHESSDIIRWLEQNVDQLEKN